MLGLALLCITLSTVHSLYLLKVYVHKFFSFVHVLLFSCCSTIHDDSNGTSLSPIEIASDLIFMSLRMRQYLIYIGILLGWTQRSEGFAYPRARWNPFASGRVSPDSIARQQKYTTSMKDQQGPEVFNFESNVARVMDIIINSLYSNRDVFFRELISNAADACDKKRFVSLTKSAESDALHIRIYADRSANTLTVEDNGIGMSRDDLIKNLGRIAESGTKAFKEKAKSSQAPLNLIGQFGVGFYSGFLVADKISVVTKSEGEDQLRWEAFANKLDSYAISKDASSPPIKGTGTRVILSLKEDSDQYLDEVTLKGLINKYSEFIPVPIELFVNVSRPEAIPDTSKQPGPDGAVPTKTVMKRTAEWQVINSKKPLWLRPPKNCSEGDYAEFYKQTFQAYEEPMAHTHFAVEGSVDFKALLFLPSELPYELSRDMFSSSARCMRLYVKRVFINDKFEDLLPRWLLFVKGVVDSEELPLNVGREILQNSRSLRIIKDRLTKKSIDMIADLAANNETAYRVFWRNFGKYLKVGAMEEEQYRSDLIPLCRFYSSYNDGIELTSLPEYVSRMRDGQKSIYYVVGDTLTQAASSPLLERIRSKGFEVLYVSEPVDEMTLQSMEKYGDFPITDVGKAGKDADLSEEERRARQEQNDDLQEFRDWILRALRGQVARVEVSSHLIDSPATIVQTEHGMSPSMQKYIRQQAVATQEATGDLAGVPGGMYANVFNQAVLEINPNHPIIKHLKSTFVADPESTVAVDSIRLMFETAKLSAGYVLDNSAEYSRLVVKLMTRMTGEEVYANDASPPSAISSSGSSSPLPVADEADAERSKIAENFVNEYGDYQPERGDDVIDLN
jgi:molecular chaperone HtpG